MSVSKDIVNIEIKKDAFKTTMICSAILLFKCVASNMNTGGKRVKSGARPPEDADLFKKAGN